MQRFRTPPSPPQKKKYRDVLFVSEYNLHLGSAALWMHLSKNFVKIMQRNAMFPLMAPNKITTDTVSITGSNNSEQAVCATITQNAT